MKVRARSAIGHAFHQLLIGLGRIGHREDDDAVLLRLAGHGLRILARVVVPVGHHHDDPRGPGTCMSSGQGVDSLLNGPTDVRLARAKLARRDERLVIDRPVGMVVGDPGRLDLVFQLFALDCLRAAGADGVRRIRFLAFELRLSHRNRWTSAFGIGNTHLMQR